MKNNSCNPCEGCSEIVSSDCISVQSSISCIDMSIGDNLTDVLNALGSQLCNFYNIIDGGSGLTVEEVDGTPSYTAINTLRFNQDSGFIVTQLSANTADVRLIPTFLFPDGDYVTVDMVSTGNIALTGVQSLDGQTGIIGVTRVLVWKQTTKSQNGVYLMQFGSWTRATDSDTTGELNNQVVFANYPKAGSTYGGKYFNQIAVSPIIGSDNIVYQLPPSGNKQAWLLDGNDLDGVEKWLGTISNDDFPIRTNNTEKARVFKTGQLGIGITSSPSGTLHIKGLSGISPLYAINFAGTHSLEYTDTGTIQRNTFLFSKAFSTTITTWGYLAGNINSGAGNTFIGANSGLVNGATVNNTFVGYQAGKANVASSNTYIGKEAALAATTGTQQVVIGAVAGAAMTTSTKNTIIGYHAMDAGSGDENVIIGNNVAKNLVGNANFLAGSELGNSGFLLGSSNIVISDHGLLASNNVNTCIIFGHGATANGITSSIGIGHNVALTGDNQFVLGSSNYPVNNMYIGQGVNSVTPSNLAIYATAITGTDANGTNLTLVVSRATGNGTSGDLMYQYAPPGSTGTAQTTATTGLIFKGIDGSLRSSRRIEAAKGANIVAANDLTLGGDGNSFTITGNTTINAITTANWQSGSVIILIFTGTPTVKNATAGGAGTAQFKLLNGVDFTISKNPTVMTFLYDGTNFLEVSRSANAA